MWGGFTWAGAAWASQPQYGAPVLDIPGIAFGGDYIDRAEGYAFGGDYDTDVAFGGDERE